MKPKVTVIDRRSCRTSFYALTILLFLLATESCLPSSCGPGNLSDAPLISNLVDYTVPPSGIILRPSTFDTVSVYFLRWIDKNSFSIPSDLQLWLVDEGVEYDRHNPGTLLDATTVISNPQWPEFDPDDPQRTYCNPNDNNFCGRLDLSVDSTGMDPGLYLVRLKEGSLVSDEGHSLDDHADTLIRLVLDGAESDAPFVVQASVPKWDEVENPDPFKFLVPHKQLVFTFSEEMGFINNSPNLINGFNLVHDVEHSPTGPLRSVVKSESIQGFRPGTVYQLDFLSSDSMPNGVPYTMDLSGNALSDVGVLPEPSTTTYFFETSHVRILYPLNAPFTDDPFVWYYEGKPIITVDYSDEVAYVKCENVQDSATIRFNRKDVESGQSYMLIEANKIEQRVEGQLEHVLQVHAYGFNDEYLGHDKISVNTCPYPNYAEGVSPIADYVYLKVSSLELAIRVTWILIC